MTKRDRKALVAALRKEAHREEQENARLEELERRVLELERRVREREDSARLMAAFARAAQTLTAAPRHSEREPS